MEFIVIHCLISCIRIRLWGRMIRSCVGFLGRALISIFFIVAALQKVLHWSDAMQCLQQALTGLSPYTLHQPLLQGGLDWTLSHTAALLSVAVVMQLLGGLLVFLGLSVRFGAFLLSCCVVVGTLVLHRFWEMTDSQAALDQVVFMKNVGILGGLLFILARGKKDAACTPKKQVD